MASILPFICLHSALDLRVPLDLHSLLLEGTLHAKLSGNALNTVVGIEVLVAGDHPDTSRALAGDND